VFSSSAFAVSFSRRLFLFRPLDTSGLSICLAALCHFPYTEERGPLVGFKTLRLGGDGLGERDYNDLHEFPFCLVQTCTYIYMILLLLRQFLLGRFLAVSLLTVSADYPRTSYRYSPDPTRRPRMTCRRPRMLRDSPPQPFNTAPGRRLPHRPSSGDRTKPDGHRPQFPRPCDISCCFLPRWLIFPVQI
jgi:hypothetical protein